MTGTAEPPVVLASDHPGAADPAYLARRAAIAALAAQWRPGRPPPEVEYTATEHATWREVRRHLAPLWRDHACSSFRAAVGALDLPVERVPGLAEVTAALAPLTGWTYRPVGGLAPLRDFYGAFADATFCSTQYLRHHSRPLYTPEPDLCHEVLGHAHHLADPRIARLYEAMAAATARLETPAALASLSRVFWRTVEFGLVREGGRVVAWGAGLLSSYGELRALGDAAVLAVDLDEMARRPYAIDRYQSELYCAPAMSWVTDDLGAWIDRYDDDTVAPTVAGGSST